MDPKHRFKVVDLFAGCGGFSLGLELAGFEPIYVNELNDDARATYLANRLDHYPKLAEFQSADIKEMLADGYLASLRKQFEEKHRLVAGEPDLIVGGPPCQGFSGIGHRRSYAVDKRDLPSNHLYRDMATVITALRPRAFVFENVKGLLTARWTPGGSYIWPDVLSTFKALEQYDVAYQLVYAKDYGVPQNRPRVLLVGVRNDVTSPLLVREGADDQAVARGFLPPPCKGAYPDPKQLLDDLLVHPFPNGGITETYPTDPQNEVQAWFRTPRSGGAPLGKGAAVRNHKYSKHNDQVTTKFEAMHAGRGVPEELRTKKFAQRLLPPVWDARGPTITATSLPDDYVHYASPRTLTVREWARLQTFPDWYQFEGPRTTGGLRRAGNPREGLFKRDLPQYTQIGNAVPVALAKEVGDHLAKILG